MILVIVGGPQHVNYDSACLPSTKIKRLQQNINKESGLSKREALDILSPWVMSLKIINENSSLGSKRDHDVTTLPREPHWSRDRWGFS